ncbi:MAG: TolC family protein, partial [Burkholderiaceae bacterium]
MKAWIWIALGAWVLPAWAQSLPAPVDLPSAASARQWMEQDPGVQAARSALAAAGHTANMLTVSPYEWTTRLTAQRRSFERGSSSKEWHAQLERPIRIGGKAALDRQLGDVELEIAIAAVGEAVHESARLLLELWIDGLAAAQAEKLLSGQLAFAQANLSAVKRRKKAGDASALEVSVASADLSDVQRQAELAKSTLDKARAKLRIRFAGVQLPEQVMADPLPPAYPEAHWLQRVLDTADPLKVALGQLRRAELTASRTSADRLPDPTVGVFAASEGFRTEQIVGVSISIPLGGTYRKERMLRALQEAEVARA